MAMLDEVETYLEALGTISYPIRKGFIPTDVTEVMVLSEQPGTGAELGFGHVGIYLENPLLQVAARGEPDDYAAPRAQLELAFQALPKIQAEELTGTLYHTVIPRQGIFLMYVDEKRRPVLGFTLDVAKRPSA